MERSPCSTGRDECDSEKSHHRLARGTPGPFCAKANGIPAGSEGARRKCLEEIQNNRTLAPIPSVKPFAGKTYSRKRRQERISNPLDATPEAEPDSLGKHCEGELPQNGDLPQNGTWSPAPETGKRTEPVAVRRNPPLSQLHLDLGQANFSCTTCTVCGMVYAQGEATDEKLHGAFHRNFLHGIRFQGWQNERVVLHDGLRGRVILVLPHDPPGQQKRVKEICTFVENQLGLVPGWILAKPCKVFLYVTRSKRVGGCLVAESITSANPVIPCASAEEEVESSYKPPVHSASQPALPSRWENPCPGSTAHGHKHCQLNVEAVHHARSQDALPRPSSLDAHPEPPSHSQYSCLAEPSAAALELPSQAQAPLGPHPNCAREPQPPWQCFNPAPLVQESGRAPPWTSHAGLVAGEDEDLSSRDPDAQDCLTRQPQCLGTQPLSHAAAAELSSVSPYRAPSTFPLPQAWHRQSAAHEELGSDIDMERACSRPSSPSFPLTGGSTRATGQGGTCPSLHHDCGLPAPPCATPSHAPPAPPFRQPQTHLVLPTAELADVSNHVPSREKDPAWQKRACGDGRTTGLVRDGAMWQTPGATRGVGVRPLHDTPLTRWLTGNKQPRRASGGMPGERALHRVSQPLLGDRPAVSAPALPQGTRSDQGMTGFASSPCPASEPAARALTGSTGQASVAAPSRFHPEALRGPAWPPIPRSASRAGSLVSEGSVHEGGDERHATSNHMHDAEQTALDTRVSLGNAEREAAGCPGDGATGVGRGWAADTGPAVLDTCMSSQGGEQGISGRLFDGGMGLAREGGANLRVSALVAAGSTRDRRVRTAAASVPGGGALLVGRESREAHLGIRVVLVSAELRRQGIAHKLLDAGRCNCMTGYIVPKSKIAFTQPTPDGRRLAAAYTDTQQFLVYS